MDELYLPGDLGRLEDKDLSGRHYSSAGASLGAKGPLSADTILGTLGGTTSQWAGCRLDKAQRLRTSLVRAKHAEPAFAKRAAGVCRGDLGQQPCLPGCDP